jgi:penicillin-binding protein 2
LNGLYAPGSTFKPAVTAAALSEGVVTAQTKVECAGVYTYYQSYQPKCWIYNSTSSDQRQHGFITADEALRVSCNCYYYEVGRVLGIDRMNDYCTRFGLGLPTGIELGEATGILAGPAWREATHQKDWMATDTIAAAIGQSDNAFTPMQLSTYISTLVNGGTRYGAHLLYRVTTPAGEVVYEAQPQVLDSFTLKESHRQEILYGMEQVISSSSSISNWMRRVPVKVAGKTGTAQVGGKADDNGLFVCCAPSRQPDIVVTSVIERSGGGSYAALAASRVLEAYYQ